VPRQNDKDKSDDDFNLGLGGAFIMQNGRIVYKNMIVRQEICRTRAWVEASAILVSPAERWSIVLQ